MTLDRPEQLDALDFEEGGGLVPVVVQHARTGAVLMLAYADREALGRTLETGVAWYWSRSRGRLWRKGETSGHEQRVVSLHLDCDADAVLARVDPAGPACHTGAATCFMAALRGAASADATMSRPGHPDAPADAVKTPAEAAKTPAEAVAAPADASATAPERSVAPARDPAVAAAPGSAPLPTIAALAAVLEARAADAPDGSYTAALLADGNLRLKKLGEEAIELALACAAEDADAAASEAADLLYHTLVACLGAGVRLDDVLAVLDHRAGG